MFQARSLSSAHARNTFGWLYLKNLQHILQYESCTSEVLGYLTFIIGGSKGGTRDACPPRGPNSFIFIQFSTKNLQNNRLAHPLWELAPPQENPGSATAYITCELLLQWFFCNWFYEQLIQQQETYVKCTVIPTQHHSADTGKYAKVRKVIGRYFLSGEDKPLYMICILNLWSCNQLAVRKP